MLASLVAVFGVTAELAQAEDGSQTAPAAAATTQSGTPSAPASSDPQGQSTQGTSPEATAPTGNADGSGTAGAAPDDAPTVPAPQQGATGQTSPGKAATTSSLGANLAPVSSPTTSAVPVSSEPQQETVSSADSTIDNGATVGQASGQAQQGTEGGPGQGQAQGQGQGQGQSNGNGSGSTNSQQAGTGQTAGGHASASSNGVGNNSGGVRVGSSDAGNQGGIEQANATEATAAATNTQTTDQSTGAAAPPAAGATTSGENISTASGQQSATAVAGASATDPQNTIVVVRVDAPGNNASFDQSNTATAGATAANAAPGATPVQQSAGATASATLERPSNVAVELRIESDGNSAGGSQRNEASAGASAANAGAANASPVAAQAAAPGSAVAEASASVDNPQNTFVSIRVNSDGETGAVEQSSTEVATETADGEATSTTSTDPSDSAWAGESADGAIAVSFASDGQNTDLRLEVDFAGLPEPTAGGTFVWTWDLVFGPGLDPACTIGSATAGSQVSWAFDCDPEDQVTTRSAASPATAPVGSISWTWNWERSDLPDWSWNREDILPLLTCPTCTYVFNFNWRSLEPVEPAATEPPTSEAGTTSAPAVDEAPAIVQSNDVSAAASAENTSDIVQVIAQSQEGEATQLQNVVQTATVEQDTLSRAIARLLGSLNQSIALGGIVAQETTSTALATARAESSIMQSAAQGQQGADESSQGQLAIQSAVVAQAIDAIGASSLRDAVNSTLSQNAVVAQAAVVLGAAGGTAVSSTRQSSEQLQAGADSQQLQVSGQWETVAQSLELVAAAVLERTLNESAASGDTSSQTIGARSNARGSSSSTTSQGVFQSQSGDTAIQSQEAYQIATIEQTGSASAGTSAGSIVHRYATPPAGTAPAASDAARPDSASSQAEPIVIAEAVAVVETSATTAPAAGAAPIVPTARRPIAQVHGAVRTHTAGTHAARPDAVLGHAVGAGAVQAAQASLPQTLSSVSTQISSSLADAVGAVRHPAAVEASSEAADDEDVAGGSRRSTSGPAPFGASAGSVGATSGGALAALAALFVLVAPGLGRRLFSQIGKRSAVFLLIDTRPG